MCCNKKEPHFGAAIAADGAVAREVEGCGQLRDKEVLGAEEDAATAGAEAIPLDRRKQQQLLHTVHLADGARQLILREQAASRVTVGCGETACLCVCRRAGAVRAFKLE